MPKSPAGREPLIPDVAGTERDVPRNEPALPGAVAPEVFLADVEARADALRRSPEQLAVVVPRLVELVRSESPGVDFSASEALSSLDFEGAAAVPIQVWIDLFESRQELSMHVETAATALGRLGGDAAPAVPAMVRALEDEDPDVRSWAVQVLGGIGEPAASAIPALLATLRDERGNGTDVAQVRDEAIRVLGKFALDEKRILPAIAPLLSDDYCYVREIACEVVGKYGPAAAPYVPALIEAMGNSIDGAYIDGDDEPFDIDTLRADAATALGEVGPAAASAVPVLIEALSEKGKWLPSSAVRALGRIGPAAAPAIPALKKLKRRRKSLAGDIDEAIAAIGS